MSHVASLRVLMIASLAASLSALTLSLLDSGSARAEDTCLAAPKSGAPAGSHWRYRLERGTQRKCWHLVANGRQVESKQAEGKQAEGQTTEPQKSETPRRGRNAALRAEPAPQNDPQPQTEKLTQTEPQPGPAPINDAVQRFTQPLPAGPSGAAAAPQSFGNAFPPVQATPSAPPPTETVTPANAPTDPAPAAADASPRIGTDATTADAQSTAAPAAPVVVSKRKAPSSDVDTMRMLPFAIGALAASLVAAGFIFASASRRRHDAVVRIVDLNTKAPPRRATRDVASPPLAMREPWHDDVSDEADALQRRSPARQRAA